jgi:hypothetical protein
MSVDADALYLAEWDLEREGHPAGANGSGWQDPADELWTARPGLTHLHDYARARRASPWAVLGVTLARIVTLTPPWVVLPPFTGGEASLNLYVGLVGPSGAGKGAAEGAAAAALDVDEDPTIAGIGSGEGLAHLFAKRKRGGELEQHTEAVLLSIPEIDTLTALGGRHGATLLPELRKAWSGERLGFSYADYTKRIPINAHTYRLALIAGIQPKRAATILGDEDAGTPQRFLWMPATDPYAPDKRPDCPPPWGWKLPHWPAASDARGLVVLPVCAHAAAAMDNHRLITLRGSHGEALEAHGPLARLKVAAALALLDGRAEVTDDDWDLSHLVVGMSRQTRDRVVEALRRSEVARNRARAEFDAERAVIVEDRVSRVAMQRVAAGIVKRLRRADGWATRTELRRATTSKDRQWFDVAIESLTTSGEVEMEETNVDGAGRDGQRYRVNPGRSE